jgi:hypothetical protein
MKLTKAIILPVASAALVVAGAGAVLAATAPNPSAVDPVILAAAPATPAPGAAAQKAPLLTSVLDGLVAKGTITTGQEQAIVDAWVAKRGDIKAQRQQLRQFLSDGVLTADELAQLPADSPLQRLAPLMKDGRLSVSDLRAIGRGILRELRAGGGQGPLRGLVNGGAAAPSASPAAGG